MPPASFKAGLTKTRLRRPLRVDVRPIVATDTVPDAFSLGADDTGIAPLTLAYSDVVTMEGLNAAAAVTLVGADSEFQKNGTGSWYPAGTTGQTVINGDTLQVRITTGSAGSTKSATLTVGGVSDTWQASAQLQYAAVTTVEILGPTEIDTAGVPASLQDGVVHGVVPDGWVAKYTMPYNAAYNLVANSCGFLVQDSGYDDAGNVVTRQRYLRGSRIMRKQNTSTATYNVEPLLHSNSGGVYTVYVALQNDVFMTSLLNGNVSYGAGLVYHDTVIVRAFFLPGFYGAAQDGDFNGTPVNSSSRTYYIPEPLHANTPREIVGATRSIEVGAYHRYGQEGRMAACVKVRGIDTTGNTTGYTTVAVTALSDLQNQGQRIEVFKASYSTAALNQNELCRDHVIIYPWIGTSAAIYDSENYAGVQDKRRARRWVNNKNGTYAGAIAAVKVGASGGTVQNSLTLARTTPFPTIKAVVDALPAWNNTNKGHNDCGGALVYLMDTGGLTHTLASGMVSTTVGIGQMMVLPDPNNTSTVTLAGTTSTRTLPSLMRFHGFSLTKSTVSMFSGLVTTLTGEGHTSIVTDCAVDLGTAGTTAWIDGTNNIYLRNIVYTGSPPSNQVAAMGSNGSNAVACLLALGIVNNCTGATGNSTGSINVVPYNFAGCRGRFVWSDPGSTSNQPSNDGCVFINNLIPKIASLNTWGGVTQYNRGLYIGQNVFEHIESVSTSVAADGNLVQQLNVVAFHNTVPAERTDPDGVVYDMGRFNFLYADDKAMVGKLKRGVQKFNLFGRSAIKTDTFNYSTQGAGRVGNHETHYRVDCLGNTIMMNRTPGVNSPNEGWWGGSVAAPYERFGVGTVPFTDPKAGVGVVGGGTYTLAESPNIDGDYIAANDNRVLNAVPLHCGMLSFDLAGDARKQDGTGANGAYEWAA